MNNNQGESQFERELSEKVRERLDTLEHQYEQGGFRDLVSSLNRDNPQEDPRFITEGAEASVYKVHHRGRDLIARIPNLEPRTVEIDSKNEFSPGERLNRRIHALALGQGLESLEQIVACSSRDKVCFTAYIPGKRYPELLPEEVDTITQDHLEQADKVITAALQAGLELDTAWTNVIVKDKSADPQRMRFEAESICFIDYAVSSGRELTPLGEYYNFLAEFVDSYAHAHTEDERGAWEFIAEDALRALRVRYPNALEEYQN